VLVWHYHDDDLPGPDAQIELALDHLPLKNGAAKVTQYRVDGDHSNSYTAWQRMGSPAQPTPEQYAQLEKAGQLAEFPAPETIQTQDGHAAIHLNLPRQGLALLVITWE
jgi:xylan 1,4-beta-xylosidase